MADDKISQVHSFPDAIALARQERDAFYPIAFFLREWLATLICHTRRQYADNKSPRDRSLQTGHAWRLLKSALNGVSDDHCWRFFACILRLLRYDQTAERELRRAMQKFLLHEKLHPALYTSANTYYRDGLQRLCLWVDAEIHFTTHAQWQFAPACFDPDPERRDLAQTGLLQRFLDQLDAPSKTLWQTHFNEVVERYKNSPKWPVLGRALAHQATRVWRYETIETLVLNFWPLLKMHNWTYRDLLNVVRAALPRSRPSGPSTLNAQPSTVFNYPIDRDQDFAAYCTNVLGLRKTKTSVTARSGLPSGSDIALELAPNLLAQPWV